MDNALDLLGVLVFIVGVVLLAAAVTYSVVKLTPQRKEKAESEPT